MASVVWANVYPSGVAVSAGSVNDLTGTAKVTYVLNENADGDGTNPGVKIEVLDDTSAVVRTVTIARQLKGTHEFEWDGRNDAGTRVSDANKNYTVKVTASDFGYTSWTKISTDQTSTSFYTPVGVSVNQNPSSPYYGNIYVSNAVAATTTFGRTNIDGLYRLSADCAEISSSAVGITWGGDKGPFKSTIGADDRLYVVDYSKDLAYDMAPDLSSAVQLVDATNKATNQWVSAIAVQGTQAAGNRKIYLDNANYSDTAKRGVIRYDLGANATATAGDTGTQIVGPTYVDYYGTDVELDSTGALYYTQYRYTPNQAPAISKFPNVGPFPEATPIWEADGSYTGAYGIAVYEPKGWVAYGHYYNGSVHLFDSTTGAHLAQFTEGTRCREVAFDVVGNLYTVDNYVEWLRVWSPPDGPNSAHVTSAAINLNSKAGSGGPVITDQPDDVAICAAGTATFNVTATGGTLAYKWKKNGVELTDGTDVSGSATASLTLSNVPATDDGAAITCVVTDQNGVAVSNPAVLNVGVFFSQAPISQSICQNSTATFTVSAGNVTGYQWQRATSAAPTVFTNIDGATTATLQLTNVPSGDTGTRIRCHVTGPCGEADSPTAILTVKTGPSIGNVALSYVTPDPRASGSGATFYAVINSATGPVHYQWQRNGENLADGTYSWGVVSGATGSNLVITELTCAASGSFTLAATDDCGTTTSVCTATPPVTGQSCYLQVGADIETCSNGVDDDCDGLTDCEDSDCSADPFCGVSCHDPFADWDEDGDVDMDDFADLQRCLALSPATVSSECECFDRNSDGNVDADDVSAFVACGSGSGIPADKACDNRDSGLGKIVINEFAYDMLNSAGTEITDQYEFVELYNRSSETVDISGWILKASDIVGDNNRDFMVTGAAGSGTTLIAPGGYYVFTAPSVPVPGANPPAMQYLILPSPTDIWENGPDVLELLDGNKEVVDTVVYGRNVDPALALTSTAEGVIWGSYRTLDGGATSMSVSRYLDGRDTNQNGYDFGLRLWTPGASNQGTASVVTKYTLASVDSASVATIAAGLDGSYQPALVIDPTVDTTQYTTASGSFFVNPNVIPASPQGGNAAVMWDFTTNGGNMAVSRDLMNNAGGFDLYVYLDTSFTAWGTGTGYESTSYGVMGTTDTAYYGADADASIFGNAVTANGNTGLCWVFNKVKGTTSSCKLFLVDAGTGGDASPPDGTWLVKQTIDMSAAASGWYRLSIAYDGATGNVTAKLGDTPYTFTTATGLAGQFYVGYREGTPAVPGTSSAVYLRPATFDTVP
jgi:hypothetical protein